MKKPIPHMSDFTFCMKDNSMKVHQNNAEPRTITLVDAREDTLTGSCLKRVQTYVKNEAKCQLNHIKANGGKFEVPAPKLIVV
jgi:hypothetical protein